MDDEDDFREVYSCGIAQPELLRLLQLKSSAVRDLLSRYIFRIISRGSCTEALAKALESPIPIGSDDTSLKDLSRSIILEALTAFKSSEIPSGLQSLESSQLDLLLKYVYKGFEFSFNNSSTLLVWHEKLLEVTGIGGIVRVLTDMKSV
jgi:actin related protein 2/3 complex subunit 5